MNIASILAALKALPKVELGKYSQFLAIAIPLLPEKVKYKGKLINLRATLAAAVADGDLDADDALAFVVAYVSAASVGATLPPLPPNVPPVPVAPPVDPQPHPAGRLWPASLAIELHSMSIRDEDIPCEVIGGDDADLLQIVRRDGVDSITGHTSLYLGASYIDDAGQPINFEQRGVLYLYNTASWEAVSENGRGSDRLWSLTPGAQPGDGQSQKTSNGVVNYYLAEATRTGLMDIVLHVPEPPPSAARPQGVQVKLSVLTPVGTVVSRALRLPPIR